MSDRRDFVRRVLEERHRQDEQWGGPRHDDEHTYADWLRFMRQQLGSVLVLPGKREDLEDVMRTPANLSAFEDRMVKVAALAMAAVESCRRKANQ